MRSQNSFDLVTCISVLEFITNSDTRCAFVEELKRVVKPEGFICIATPNALRIKEYHSGRILGNFIRKDGFPWSSPPWKLKSMFHEYRLCDIGRYEAERLKTKLGFHVPFSNYLQWLTPWQKFLAQKP